MVGEKPVEAQEALTEVAELANRKTFEGSLQFRKKIEIFF